MDLGLGLGLVILTNIENNIVFRYCLSTVEPDHSFTSSVNIERPLSPRRPVFNFKDINKNDEEITTIRCAHNKGYGYDRYSLFIFNLLFSASR